MGEAAELGRRVKQLRIDAKANLGDVAGALGMSIRDLSVIESGVRDIGDAELTAFAKWVDVSELAIFEPGSLLAARERPARKSPLHLTTRCISGVWDGTISAAPLAGLLGVETDEPVEKLRMAWKSADAITVDYSTPKDSPDVVEQTYDADPVAL